MGRLKKQAYDHILAQEGFDSVETYVETGSHRGEQLVLASNSGHFKELYGIEIDKHYYGLTSKAIMNECAGVKPTVIHGDTLEWLPDLAKNIDKPTLFYLDAHFCNANPPLKKSEFPLWKELDILKERTFNDIIGIDDVHTFGKVRNELKVDPNVEEWERVTFENILEYMGDIVVRHEVISDGFFMWLKK